MHRKLKHLTKTAAVVTFLSVASVHAGEIHKGMTELQVRSIYGEPNQISSNESGRTWVYTRGLAKLWIPFYGAFQNPEVITVTFRNGRVRSYSIDQ